jgi:hypothetical protein
MARHRGTTGSLTAGRSSSRPKTFEEGRVCLHPLCSTKLSRYNADVVCSLHGDSIQPGLRNRISS